MLDTKIYDQYIQILEQELVPAMGCTEPIAIAYLASYAKEVLGDTPDTITLEVSGNILKNVKSVIVPNTEKLKGIKAACAAGIVCGNASKKLEVIAQVEDAKKAEIKTFMEKVPIEVRVSDSPYIFDLYITMYKQEHCVKVRIVNYHTNIVYVEKDGEVLSSCEMNDFEEDVCDKACLNVKDIVRFAKSVAIDDVKAVLDRQIEYNMAIAQEGIAHDYGANIGKVLLSMDADNIYTKVKAYAAAASDARMNGCELPVIIVSGSGNQGISASVPVIVYAQAKKVEDELLYRALVVSNLITIHQKSGIGRLSAFCGVISAGIASGAAIAFIETKDEDAVAHTLVNALGIVSGIICDGAKASCAAKIQTAVDAGILGFHMYVNHQEFKAGDGLIEKGVENTIKNICTLAKEGMKETDKEIIKMMVKGC